MLPANDPDGGFPRHRLRFERQCIRQAPGLAKQSGSLPVFDKQIAAEP